MCGITGYIGEGSKDTLEAMSAAIAHRGPDAHGAWLSQNSSVGLAHQRLAIIDLSPGGAQPMVSTDGRYVVVFNGEIYNFQELKKELSGYPFKSSSDTEVILAAFSIWGTSAFERLGGMFALALYDTHEHELILARDRMGKKPLYWSNHGTTLLFGSELKALRAHPLLQASLDTRSLGHYLAREYVPTPHTIYTDVQKLPPASYLRYKNNTVTIETYWQPRESVQQPLSEVAALERFDELLSRATHERLVADVPVGIFLSGGIDSSTVAYYASKTSTTQIQTFSIGFSEKSFDESSHARLVAKHLGTNHHEALLSAHDALALVQDISEVFDEPVADASVLPTLLLSRFTREHVTVALGGDGADELLLGYPTFKAEQYAKAYSKAPSFVRNAAKHAASHVPAASTYMNLGFKARKFTHDFTHDPLERHLQWLGSFREDELSTLLAPEVTEQARGITRELTEQWRGECPDLTGMNALSHLYLRTYLLDQVLVKVDRASMRYALEVRAPFLSTEIVEFLVALPPEMKYHRGTTKYLLKKLMRGKLPNEIIDRPKQGFAAPTAAWLRHELKDLLIDTLAPSHLASGLFNAKEVQKLVHQHLEGSHNHAKKLWTLLVFQLWWDRWMK
ncbi:MAG: hypothetical protein QG621_142 [Patescibacteria group bacterium]|nr:hypothetical protein [Patescibacteria group bacterium]